MEFYGKMISNLGDMPVREDGEFEPYVQYDTQPTYGVFFDEVYGTPLRAPRRPYAIPDSGCNRAFQSPYSNMLVPAVKSNNSVDYVAYDSPGPGIVRYATFPTDPRVKISTPFTNSPTLPAVIKGANTGTMINAQIEANRAYQSTPRVNMPFLNSIVNKIN